MTWREFISLVSCLSVDTPLGRTVQIRSETDQNVLSKFTPQMKKIRNEWLNRRSAEQKEADYNKSMDEMLSMLLA